MFRLNGKEYPDIELTFNDLCNLQERGIDITDPNQKNMFGTIRGVIAIRFGGNVEVAGREIEQHIVAGGSFQDVIEIVTKAVEKSGFFQALTKTMPQ